MKLAYPDVQDVLYDFEENRKRDHAGRSDHRYFIIILPHGTTQRSYAEINVSFELENDVDAFAKLVVKMIEADSTQFSKQLKPTTP